MADDPPPAAPGDPNTPSTDPALTDPAPITAEDAGVIGDVAALAGAGAPADAAPDSPPTDDALADHAAIDELLRQASFEDPSSLGAASGPAFESAAAVASAPG